MPAILILAQRMQLSKKQRDALQSCEQRPHNLPLVEASNAQEKKVWSDYATSIRGRLHDKFQPGLKFQCASRAEILLQLHD